MSKAAAKVAAHEHFPSFLRSRAQAKLLDKWVNNRQYEIEDEEVTSRFNGQPYRPRGSSDSVTDEYEQLESIVASGWAGLVVKTLAQTSHVDGIRMPGANENLSSWATWQANRWDATQIPVHRCAIGLGVAYGIALPGKNPLTGDKQTKYLARSPMQMAAFYSEDDDEWAMFALEASRYGIQEDATRGIIGDWGWTIRLYDEQVTHFLTCKHDGENLDDWEYITYETHGLPVPPVARLTNSIDLEGRAIGEIEPVLPLLRRIDQDVFDRLIVQRYGAWKVRYISGMAKPKNSTEERAQAIRLRVQDLLISGNKDTKFGTLDETDPKGFESVTDADLRMLAAITQTPPHHLLGISSNLQAEALAAAEAGLMRKSGDFRTGASEFHEQMARMDAMYRGDTAVARAVDLQVRWRDNESRSLVQAADALGKLAVQLKVPVEMLWEKIPNWSDSDTKRAKELIENGTVEQLLAEFMGGQEETQQTGGPDAPPSSGQ